MTKIDFDHGVVGIARPPLDLLTTSKKGLLVLRERFADEMGLLPLRGRNQGIGLDRRVANGGECIKASPSRIFANVNSMITYGKAQSKAFNKLIWALSGVMEVGVNVNNVNVEEHLDLAYIQRGHEGLMEVVERALEF